MKKQIVNKLKKKDLFSILILTFLFTLSITWDSYSSFNIIIFLTYYILSFIILYYFWNLLKQIVINKQKGKISRKEFILYAILILSILTFAIFCYYPGYLYGDSITQYNQVLKNTYNNWHPVLHTLFLYKLPSLIYNSILSSTLFQCLIVFSIMIYFCYFLRKNFLSFYQTLFVLIIVILNPLFIKYSVSLLKDVLYSWFLFLSTLYVINIIFSYTIFP